MKKKAPIEVRRCKNCHYAHIPGAFAEVFFSATFGMWSGHEGPITLCICRYCLDNMPMVEKLKIGLKDMKAEQLFLTLPEPKTYKNGSALQLSLFS